MLSSLTIKNYKSIVDLPLELGSFNVFIGENGSGKSNVLEALAMLAAGESRRLANEDLIARGVRIARSSLTTNAFKNHQPQEEMTLGYAFLLDGGMESVSMELSWQGGRWFGRKETRSEAPASSKGLLKNYLGILNHVETQLGQQAEVDTALEMIFSQNPGLLKQMLDLKTALRPLSGFGIYCASTLALRGLQTESHREPLGLFGEGLDVAISQLTPEQKEKLLKYAQMVSWLEDIDIDQTGQRKLEGYKPSRSRSNLYFTDKFLAEDNQIFSAENANEGILHILFHLTLFLHADAPRLFAIDNIEAALNPHLLRHLIKALAQLAKEEKRQALVTTHNPAALDGLNLHDDEQRLFVVYRNEEGHTQARRIKVKPESNTKLKLSELWMRGMLGGIPEHF